MKLRKCLVSCLVGVTGGLALGAGSAQATAFPDFADCPTGAVLCLNIQQTDGTLTIKDTTVDLGASLEIRGGIVLTGTGAEFAGPAGTNGFFAEPVAVPGGLLGINFPIPGNTVYATAELAGPASSIRIDPGSGTLIFPMKIKLSNPILGPHCRIGSDANPIQLVLITGTTNPPPPNRPISGGFGTPDITPEYTGSRGNVNVNNSFAVPSATGCGLNAGLVNSLINLKLGLPSAAGNNTIISENDLAVRF